MAQRKAKHARPGRPKDDQLAARRRREIVQHAIEEFARRGYNGADLDVIAREAGCSKGTLYNYFSSKGDLFSASVDHVMFSMVEAAGVRDEGDGVEQLERLIHGFLRHFSDHPQYVELLAQERSDFRDRKQPAYYRYRLISRRQWQRRFARLMAEGRMRRMPPAQAINIVGDLLYGTIFMNYFRRRRISPARQAGVVLEVLLGGLLSEAEFAAYRQRSQPPRPPAGQHRTR
jgi:AcrR family transcriptional regulator